MWWSPCPSQSASPRSSRDVLVLFSVQVLTLGARDYFRVCMWCVCEREKALAGYLAVASSSRPSATGRAAMHALAHRHSGEERAHAGHGQQQQLSRLPREGPARCPPKAVEKEIPSIISCLPILYLLLCLSRCSSSQKSLCPLCLSLGL